MHRFTIKFPDSSLDDLRTRLEKTRWPDVIPGAGWDYGTNLSYLKELCDYWLHHFDWKTVEQRLNTLPQYQVEIDGIQVHFLHLKSRSRNALPLILSSGWPSSFVEYEKVLGPLTDPEDHGAEPGEAFDLIIPSLPGFGFSSSPLQRGYVRADLLWRTLATEVLGYREVYAHGTDIGARVTSDLGRYHSDVVRAIHLGSVDLDGPEVMPRPDQLRPEEQEYLERCHRWDQEEGGYAHLQATFPQTLAYALNDSPVGLASWILEKHFRWSDCSGHLENRFNKDELITNIMIYWLTKTINSSMRRYFEVKRANRTTTPITVPTHVAMYPGEKDLIVPRSWAERTYNIVDWVEPKSGGHFPASEVPHTFVKNLRDSFRRYRTL